MRKIFAMVVGLAFISVFVAAQTHDNMKEKKVSDEFHFTKDIKVGANMLPAGDYEIVCDRVTITFYQITKRTSGDWYRTKKLEMPCLGKELKEKRAYSELSVPMGHDGVPVLAKLYIQGSNIEHVFPEK